MTKKKGTAAPAPVLRRKSDEKTVSDAKAAQHVLDDTAKTVAKALVRRERAVRRLLDRGYRPFEIQALTGVRQERVHAIKRAAPKDRSELTKDLAL